jgi:thioredoxin-related protein
MKTRNFLVPVILIFLSFSYSYCQTSYSFSEGLNAAKSSGKKIFIDIYSASDSWSKKMESEVYSSSKVQSALSDFVFVKLDVDAAQKISYKNKTYTSADLAKVFGGTGYPTFVFMNSNGDIIKFKYNNEEVSNLSGFMGEDDFVEMLNFFAQDKYKGSDLSTIFKN